MPTVYRGKALEWEYGNRLINFDGVTFAYDYSGHRLKKNDIEYRYDNDGRVIKQSNGLLFLYDNTGVCSFIKASHAYFYRKDAQGNIIAIIDSSGTVVVRYEYDAWGNHKIIGDETLGNLNPFRYRGYYYDTETGLYYLQTRYYDPITGRFISQDGVEYADPESINGLNLYAYCGNNPVMYVDPTGTAFLLFLFAAIVGFAVGFAGSAIVQATTNEGEVNWATAAIDGAFSAISSVVFMIPGVGPLLSGVINAGLTAVNMIITTGIENNWQYSTSDWITISISSILSGFVSGFTRYSFFNQGGKAILNNAHKTISTVWNRLNSDYYFKSSIKATNKALKSAWKFLWQNIKDINFDKNTYVDWFISFLQLEFAVTLGKGLKGLIK